MSQASCCPARQNPPHAPYAEPALCRLWPGPFGTCRFMDLMGNPPEGEDTLPLDILASSCTTKPRRPDRARSRDWPRTGGRSGSGVLRGARGQPGPRTGGTPGSEGSGVTSGEPPEGRTGGTPGSEGSGVTSGEPSEGGLRSAVGSGATSGGLRRGSGSGVEPRRASGVGDSGVRWAPEPPPGGSGGGQAPE